MLRHVAFAGLFTLAAAAPAAGQAPIDTTAFASLTWRSIGPDRGGRSVAVAGSAARPQEYYMGTTGGGVFKTTDGGDSWDPVTDGYFGGTIGAIAVSESRPDVVYVGGGEYPIRGNTSHGDGVYKTLDGGRTWRYMGLVETRHISKIRVHPKDPNLVYVGAMGPVFGTSPHRGVYKSIDGGESWNKVLFRDDTTGVVDLVMDPNDPNVLYAGLWTAYRRPWKLVSGGTGSGLFKSKDGGETWTEITRNPGLPAGLIGNVGITVSPANSKRLFAIIENDSGGVFRSDNAGDTWTRVNTERKLRQRAWYYSRIFADVKDENAVYVMNVQFWKSTDGGRTFPRPIRSHHGDYHDLWLAPNDPMRMAIGDDGGAEVSFNGGRSWTDIDYPTAQFYQVSTTNHFPYLVCGGQQDNSTACVSSQPNQGSHYRDLIDAGGCESGYVTARPDDPHIVFSGCYGGFLGRKDTRTGAERVVSPWPLNPMGHSAGDLKYRVQWTFPIVISPHDPNVLYVGGNVIFKSTNEGESFTVISPDLTRADPSTLGPSGGPITRDQTSVEYYATVFTIAESPKEKGVIWSGSDDGRVHITRNDGRTWQNVTPAGLPDWARISLIEASPHAAGTAYLAANRFQLNDFEPYLYKTNDFGATWTRIDAGITRSEFTRGIREDPVKRGLLFAATERGVWVSLNDGAAWQRLQLNLPPVPVRGIVIKDGDLVAGTHGRSFWVLDDISPLRQLSAEAMAKDVHLFKPRDAYRVFGGATIHYWLKRGGEKVKLDFLDARGQLIRSVSSEPDSAARVRTQQERVRIDSLAALGVMAPAARGGRGGAEANPFAAFFGGGGSSQAANKAGANSFTWNLRYPEPTSFDGLIMWAAGIFGPQAPPGTYSVRLTVGDRTETQTFALLADPRSKATQADLDEQFAFLIQIRDRTSEANNAVRTIRDVKTQLTQRLAATPAGRAATLRGLAGSLTDQLGTVEGEIYQVRNQSNQDPLNYPIKLNNQIAALSGVVASAEAKPTAQSREVYELLSTQLSAELARMRTVLRGLAAVNAELGRLGLEPIVVPTTAERPIPIAAIP